MRRDERDLDARRRMIGNGVHAHTSHNNDRGHMDRERDGESYEGAATHAHLP